MVEYQVAGLDAIYAALAHPVRRTMVERLRAGDARVTELAAGLTISLAAASKHIRVLETAGLVVRTIKGRDHHLALRVEPLEAASSWIQTNRAFWQDRLDALDELLGTRDPQ